MTPSQRSWRRALARVLATASVVAAALAGAANDAPPPPVTEADRRVAQEWTSRVDDDLRQRDPGEAARLLLRSVRWDPARWEDYRSAMELVASIDPEAAARHAASELHSEARFTSGDAVFLSQLAKAAVRADDDTTWRVAADLTRAAAEQTEKRGPTKSLLAARLWADAGDAYAARGDLHAASDAYERMQRIAVATRSERFKQANRWDLIADAHLDAAEPARAALAIELLRERDGETQQVLVLQSRLALGLDEPLAAIDHADQAIDLLGGPDDGASDGAYRAYVAAMQTVNQSDRAALRLVKDVESDPDNAALAMAAIDARINAGQYQQAWDECGALLKKLASRLPTAAGYLGADSSADPALLDRFAAAAARRIALADRVGRVSEALTESAGWAERLGNLNPLWTPLFDACQRHGFRSEAADWLDKREPDRESSSARNLSQATIAFQLGRSDVAAENLLAVFDGALRNGVDPTAVADECATWADYLQDDRRFAAAQALLEATVKRLEEKRGRSAAARLRVRLALAIISLQVDAGAGDAAAVDEALRQIAAARRQQPDDGYVAHEAVYASLYAGRYDDTIAIAEEVFERWPAPDDEDGFGSWRYHQASELFAAALLLRDGPGDAQRAGELLEESLDRWPESSLALSYLAWRDSRSPEGLSRALRLAEDAARIDPLAADSRGFLGVVQLRAGKADKGRESLRQALELADDAMLSLWERALFRRELTDALRADGRAEEAEVVESAPTAAD